MIVKSAMAIRLHAIPRPAVFLPGKPVFLTNMLRQGIISMDPFVEANSWLLFYLLDVNLDYWNALLY